MTMNPLPPQAYTKETLLKAYHWLQQQPSHIKEMAMTPDLMVSLFLKASRDGDQVLERPSITNFKSELKSLAGLMGELEGPPAPKTQPTPAAATPQASVAATVQAPPPQPVSPPALVLSVNGLDEQTSAMLRDVKERFNLSNENEALRMLVKLGFEKATAFFGGSR